MLSLTRTKPSTPNGDAVSTKEQSDFLRACGFTGIPEDHEFPTHWNPPDGTAAVTTDVALSRVSGFFKTGRAALLGKPWWKTSEAWMTVSSVATGVGLVAGSVMGLGDGLPEDVRAFLLPTGALLTAASTALYTFARNEAKRLSTPEPAPAKVAP